MQKLYGHQKFNLWRHVRHYFHLWQLTAFTDWASKNLHITTWTVHLADRWAILWTNFWMDRIWHYMCSRIQVIITIISLTPCTCNPCAYGTMQVMQYTKQLTCVLRTSSNSPTNYDCARYSSLYKILWHLQFWYTNLQSHKIVIPH